MTICAQIAIDIRTAEQWAARNQSKLVWAVNGQTAYEIDDSGYSVLTIRNSTQDARVSSIGRTERQADERASNAILVMERTMDE